MCLAKSLGGGVMPIGAYLTKPHIWDRVYQGKDNYALHTSTFGGNSLAMAAGLSTLETIIQKKSNRSSSRKRRLSFRKTQNT